MSTVGAEYMRRSPRRYNAGGRERDEFERDEYGEPYYPRRDGGYGEEELRLRPASPTPWRNASPNHRVIEVHDSPRLVYDDVTARAHRAMQAQATRRSPYSRDPYPSSMTMSSSHRHGYPVTSPISPTVRKSMAPGVQDSTHALEGVVHAAHSQKTSFNRHTTYLVGTYTGTINSKDRSEFWFSEGISPHTHAEVFIELYGKKGRSSGEQLLVHAGDDADNIFQEGAVDEFAIASQELGEITAVKLRIGEINHGRYGSNPNDDWHRALWKLEKVVVTCIQHGQGGARHRPNGSNPHETHRSRGEHMMRVMCCASGPKGDDLKKTRRTKDSTQWHFIPKSGRHWLGSKYPPGANVAAVQEELEEMQIQKVEADKRFIEAKRERDQINQRLIRVGDALRHITEQQLLSTTQNHSVLKIQLRGNGKDDGATDSDTDSDSDSESGCLSSKKNKKAKKSTRKKADLGQTDQKSGVNRQHDTETVVSAPASEPEPETSA